MTDISPVSALVGGILIGVSASLYWAFNGKVAGVSGILAGLVTPLAGERDVRACFLLGLLFGGALLLAFQPTLLLASPRPPWLLACAGIAVGAGTYLSHGCTSGHGVCGNARLAPRSLLATLTFMLSGASSAWLVRVLLAGGWS